MENTSLDSYNVETWTRFLIEILMFKRNVFETYFFEHSSTFDVISFKVPFNGELLSVSDAN